MDIGVGLWCMRSTADAPASIPVLYRELQDDARLAEALGFHSLWLSEHHFWYDGWCPSLLVAGAAALAVTERLHVGTGVFLLPLHEPERLAAEGLTLERLAPGRFELGLGLGYREAEFDGFGVSRTQRGRRADRALDVLAAAWTAGGPRMWIGGIAEKSLLRAAHRGLSLFLPSTMRNDQLRAVVDRAREAAVEHGVGLGRIGVLKNVAVTDGGAAEERAIRNAIGRGSREYGGSWWSLRGSLGFAVPELLDEQVMQAADTALVGSSARVVDELHELEQIGIDLVVLHVAADFARPGYREMMTTIAADVLPEIT